MKPSKTYRLMDLVEDLKEVDAMIELHSSNKSTKLMSSQYKAKKEKLISYLIDELVEPEVRSPKSFAIIQILIEKFYPNLSTEAKKDKEHKELNALMTALSA